MKIADISHYQGTINWEETRKELSLAIFRASIGMNEDKNYLSYTYNCKIPYGAYHYVKANNEKNAREEAKFFIKQANSAVKPPLFYVADIEYEAQNSSNTETICVAFLDELRKAGCKKIGLYINQHYKWAGSALKLCDFIWIPRYGKNTGKIPENKYKPEYYCDLWQYTSKGHINGIKGDVDLNILNGNLSLSWFTEEWNQDVIKEDKTMAEKFTNLHFVEFCKKFVGRPYWYATCVYACTSSLLNSKTKQYEEHYTSDRTSKYNNAINKHEVCADCVGMIKGYFWTNGGENVIESIGKSTPLFKNSYASNGMPDKSANGLFEYAKKNNLEWGTIGTIPEIPGLAVCKDGHVGVYIGNGEVIEEKGFAYGCVKTKLKDTKWLYWYKIPNMKYVTTSGAIIPPITLQLGDRMLQSGMKGEDVKELQKLLNNYLQLNLEVDGDFGSLTNSAVRKLQAKLGVSIDGIYGAQSHKAFMAAIADRTPVESESPEEEVPEKKMLTTTASVNCRTGDSTSYAIITTLASNAQIEPILDKQGNSIISATGWYAVRCGEQIGWISGKYIK